MSLQIGDSAEATERAVDQFREQLWAQVLLEQRVVSRAALEQFVQQRDSYQRHGRACTLGQLLMEQRQLSPQHYTQVHQEVERRLAGNSASGRMTPTTGHFQAPVVDDTGRFRMATPGTGRYAMAPGGLQQIGGSGSGRFPGPPGGVPGSGRFVTPGSGRLESSLTRSWKSPGTTPGEGGGGGGAGDFGVGRYFGAYQIVDELGRGGMGVVYRVQREGIARQMALKVLIAGEFASPKLLRRFREEAKVATDLKHPNIVAVHDVGEVDGVPYYAMDYVEGSELQELIRNRNLSVRRGVEILIDVAHAAHHAHEKGIIHRDLKPANVLVSGDGTPYIMDFGLAKNLQQDHGLTRSGVAIGTPYYMPPEQAKGQHREMGAWSDVYAMGAILYEILTRRVPFTAKTQNELLRKIVEEDPTPPRQIRSGIPVPLERIALKALRKEKDRRYQTAQAFAEDLERYLTGEAVHARADPPWYHALRWIRRNKGLAVAGVITVCALTVAGFAVAFRGGGGDPQVAETPASELTPEQNKQLEDQFARGFDHLGRYDRTHDPTTARDALNRAELEFGQAVKLEETLLGEARPRTAYYRGVVRRGLCRWADSQNDFLLAARSPEYQARAQLARGLILLRWHLNPEGARAALRQAVVGDVEDPEQARIERAANVIATAYLAFLDDEYPRARSLLDQILDRRGLERLEAEARGAYAYMARERGRMFGGDEEAERGLRPSARALELEPFRYEFLIDRSMLLARKGDRAEARARLQEARVVCPAGEGAELAEALIVALEGKEPAMLRSLRSAEEKVRGRRSTVSDRVRRFGQRLRQAFAERQPTTTPDPGIRPNNPNNPNQNPEQFIVRGPRVADSLTAKWGFPPGKAMFLFAIDIADDVQCLEIQVSDNPVKLKICGNLNRAVTNPDQADWVDTFGEGEPPHRLIVRRDGARRLGSGTYTCLIIQDRPRNRELPFRVVITLVRDPADVPPVWERMPTLDMGEQTNDRRVLQDLARRVSTSPSPDAQRRAIEEWKRLESPDYPDRALMRANWQLDLDPAEGLKVLEDNPELYKDDFRAQFIKGRALGELERYDEAIAVMDKLAKLNPKVLDPQAQVLQYYAEQKLPVAVELADALIERDPRSPLLGLLRMQVLANCAPERFAEEWEALEAQDVPHLSYVVQLLTLWREVDPLKGVEIAQRWAKREPELPAFVTAQGVLLAYGGKVEEGLAILRRLRSQLNPQGQGEVDRIMRTIESGEFKKPDKGPGDEPK